MRTTPLLAFACWLATNAIAQHELDGATAARLRAIFGVDDPHAVLTEFLADDPDVREAAHERWEQIAERHPVDTSRLLQAALWSSDRRVATGAASKLTFPRLDLAGHARFTEVGLADVFRPRPTIDFYAYRYVLSSEDVDTLLREEPPRDRDVYNILPQLHRNMRATHIPLLCRYARSAQSMLRHDAVGTLGVLSWYTDRQRELIGRTLLGWTMDEVVSPEDEVPAPYTPRDYELPKKTGGYAPVLHAVLERLFLEPTDEPLQTLRPWARRWAQQSEADDSDRRLLSRLLESEIPEAQQIATRGMRHLADPVTQELLERSALPVSEVDAIARLHARASLAYRGHEPSALALRENAEHDPEALVMWTENRGATAIREVCAIACGRDYHRGFQLIETLGATFEVTLMTGVRLPDTLGNRLELAANANEDLDFARLHGLVRHFPGCRTPRLLGRYLAKLEAEHVPQFRAEYCEVVDANGLRRRLRDFHDDQDPTVRDAALDLSLKIGDAQSAARLVEFFQEQKREDWLVLARTQHPAVRQHLLRAASEYELPESGEVVGKALAPLFAVAAHDGLPEGAASGWIAAIWGDDAKGVAPGFAEWSAKIRAGKPFEALVACLATMPRDRSYFPGLGLVRDPRVLDFLRGRARRAASGSRYDAIGELAIAGDPDARTEVRAAVRAGHYGWLDSATDRSLTLDYDPATLPGWVEELESNCCRNVAVAGVLEKMLGVDIHDIPDGAALTRAAVIRPLARKFGASAKWSRIAGHRVLVP